MNIRFIQMILFAVLLSLLSCVTSEEKDEKGEEKPKVETMVENTSGNEIESNQPEIEGGKYVIISKETMTLCLYDSKSKLLK